MAKIEKIGNIQIVDNKEDKFFYFPMISMACTGSGYEKTTDRRNNTVSVDGFTYEFDPNTMSIVFDKEFDNAIYSEWTVEMKGKSYMILTHHGIWDAGHGLTHEDTYSFELFRIMDE